MNKNIRKHIKHVTSTSYLMERYDNCKIYFEESTHIYFDQLGFKDSTWHNDEAPSFSLEGLGFEDVQCYLGNDTWEYLEDGLHRYQLYISDYCVYSSMELINVYSFIKSNLDLFKSLVNGDEYKREIEKHNNELDDIVETLEQICEFIGVDIFDMDWNNDEGEDKKDFALYSMSRAIDAIKKEKKDWKE